MFSSEVQTYFQLLSKANCEDSRDLLHAYTDIETLMASLDIIKPLYGSSAFLIEEITTGIKGSLEASNQENPKLDIFKSLQLILEKILHTKARLFQQLQPLMRLYGESDSGLFPDIISLWSHDPHRILQALRLHRLVYGGNNSPESLASLALIEGFYMDISPFI